MNVLVIDHQDSFTYNLVQLLEVAGANVYIREYSTNCFNEIDTFTKILLSPGPGKVEEYPNTLNFIKSLSSGKSILGICLGFQIIGVAFGASLFRLPNVQHGYTEDIHHFVSSDQTSILYELPSNFGVGLYHSWALEEHSIKAPLSITAISDSNVVMGVKHSQLAIEGVQFHPESFLCGHGVKIIQNWLKL
ncbi:MAG: aminodeoxychorismate/anthranilate synthase component II [Saprospiraceae bacterium]|nr:aminodeoxychorismate/anthranilate synthase component II [Saprospiraceae bacterium]